MASTIKCDTIQSTTSNVFFQNSVGTEYARFDSTGVFQLANPSSFAAGTAALPSITATGDTNTGIYFPAADTIAFSEGGAESMRIDSGGNMIIGGISPTTSSGYTSLSINNATNSGYLILQNNGTNKSDWYVSGGTAANLRGVGVPLVLTATGANYLSFETNSTDRARIDSSGNFGVGTTSPARRFESRSVGGVQLRAAYDTSNYIDIGHMSSATGGVINSVGDATVNRFLAIQLDGTERMRISGAGHAFFSGNYSVLYPGSGNTTTGIFLESDGQLSCSRDNTTVARFNRNSTDGTLLSLSRQGTEIGTVSVSSGTVSYNAFAGSHWSQLSDGSKPNILRGTVLDSINELVQWPDEPTTERLCKVKVSDTAGSKKVYGVFMAWDNDWTATNDMYVTAVGAFICRVNASVTVQSGDLLESNGDGTARVQADDLIRSSTIGKVTCTEKTHQYDDGSYCVPTVLYCG
jgi:hypothetical protein